MCLCQEPAFNSRATANAFSKEDTERYPVQPGFQRMDLEGLPRKPVRPRYCHPEPEGDREIENSFMLRSAGKNNQPHCRRCGDVTAKENLTAPLDLTVSQCDCAHVWTAGTVKPSNRGAEESQHLCHNKTGRRGRTQHAQLWSERLETKDVEYVGKSRQGNKTAQPKTKSNAQISCQDLREESDNPRGGTQLCRSDGHQEIATEYRKIQDRACELSPAGQDIVKGRLRARNWRLTYLAKMEENR